MAEDADLFDNDAERYRFFLNVFKDSEDEIDFDGSDIFYLMNITEVLSKIEIDQAEIDVVYKTILNGTF